MIGFPKFNIGDKVHFEFTISNEKYSEDGEIVIVDKYGTWDEWAKSHGIKVVNVPVGFKEIANIMKKVELQIKNNPDKEVVVDDVFGNSINLGVQPRLIFGGEESGGMIM